MIEKVGGDLVFIFATIFLGLIVLCLAVNVILTRNAVRSKNVE